MNTCAKTGITCPILHPTLLLTHAEPKTTKQALADPTWLAAKQSEYDALLKNNTWTYVTLPSNRVPIGCKWVFHIKENPDVTVNKYKAARLVAKGFHQRYGDDYTETFSPLI